MSTESSPAPGPSPRTFGDNLLDAWYTAPSTTWLGTAAVLLFQVIVGATNNNAAVFGSTAIWLLIITGQAAGLLLRRRWNVLATVIVIGLVVVASLAFDAAVLCYPPMFYLLGSVVLRGRLWSMVTTATLSLMTIVLDTAWNQTTDGTGITGVERLYPLVCTLLMIVSVAALLRWRRQVLDHRDQRTRAEWDTHAAVQRQRRAESVTQLATDLHDSVGHNLTGIITLTEGLSDHATDSRTRAAVGMINSLAREALQQTRQVVTALHPVTEGEDIPPPTQDHKTWADLDHLLENTRATGLSVILMEHGQRPFFPEVQDLSYQVIRESLTNVLRHARDASRVAIAIAFEPTRTALTVSDNGRSPANPHVSEGNGIKGIRRRVEQAQGHFLATPSGHGWSVRAVIPHPTEATTPTDAGSNEGNKP